MPRCKKDIPCVVIAFPTFRADSAEELLRGLQAELDSGIAEERGQRVHKDYTKLAEAISQTRLFSSRRAVKLCDFFGNNVPQQSRHDAVA
eukprot:1474320-Amphidinium_carterae.1